MAIHCEGDTQMNIMLIDDDKDCILSLAGAVEPTGHSCEMFTKPERAVELYDGKRYDVVITDMRMPGMNGIEVLKAIRGHNHKARVIIITGYSDVEAVISAMNFGAYAFLGKPVNIGELIETIEKIGAEVEQREEML